jgi:hypothetical protein
MLAIEVYNPEHWREFFLMVGSGAAALTGLVFVSMTLNLKVIARDPTHRNRAIGTLAGFTAAFMICGLSLIGGQDHVVVGIEWLIISSIAWLIYLNGYVRALKENGSKLGLSVSCTIGSSICYLAEIIGSIILIAGHIIGLQIAATALIIYFYYMISGAWLLILGVHEHETQTSKK